MNVRGARTVGMGVACLGMLLSVPVHALSLGGIQVKSALDEPLRAEINLESADPDTLESLQVELGSREDFQRADVPRAEFLSELQFSVTTRNGEPVVVVTTEQPVKEPFLHFLVSAEWSGGKLVREYTGLLDPPLYTAEAPASVESPSAGETVPAEEPVEPAPSPDQAGSGAGAEPAAASSAGAPGRSAEYGPTREGDTLWSIASSLDTGSLQVNVFQVMIALLRENPDAFINNNINRLKTGQVLRLSDLDAIAEISRTEASRVYTAQLDEWQSYRTRVAAAGVEPGMAGDPQASAMADSGDVGGMSDEPATTGSGETADQRAAADGGEARQVDGTTEEEEVLRIVQAGADEAGQAATEGVGADRSGEIAEMRSQIATLEETLESRSLENEELRERVRLLESQLENAQRLIEIESQELAAAQQQAAQRQSGQNTGAESGAADTQASDPDPAEASVASVEGSSESEAVAPESSAGAETGQVSGTSAGQAAAAASTEQSTPAAGTAASGEATTKRVRKVVDRPPRTSWWSSLPDLLFSSWMTMVGAGAAVLLLLLGLLMFLRRRQSIAEFEESILSGSTLDSYSETTDTAGTSASDTSFLSDFGTAGMGTMQADEVDPLAEAEVYLAYGRDEQAEEVLKEAARRDPERPEIKLKLLEIYKQRNDVKSFETIAEELYPASEQEDPEIWRQVSAMGRELSPDNPLFQEPESAPAGAGGPAAGPKVATTTQRAPAPASPADELDALNFDMDDFGSDRNRVDTRTAADDTVPAKDTGVDIEADAAPSSEVRSGDRGEVSDDGTLDLGEDFLKQATRNVDPSEQPFPEPDEQTDLDQELERLASERERASTSGEGRPASGAADSPEGASQKPGWETAEPETDDRTLDFPSSDTSEIDFDLNLDESSISSQSGSDDDQSGLEMQSGEPARPDSGEGVLEFESENIPPEETWAGPSSDAPPAAADDEADSLAYSPEDNVQSTGAAPYNEAETKLDLARAYLDMGDKVGARSIIDEVMREGDPAQRDRAAELASQL